MTKVLISDKMSPRAAEIFKDRGVEVDEIVGMTPEELAACIGDYDGLAIRSATKVTEEILAAATNLKVVGRAGIGVDNVDIPGATGRGVVVMNTPFGNSITTAEHAIAMMFALARQIPAADLSTQAGKWEKSRFMGVEVTGKTLGLIGCGNIGSIVAERALGLRMKVVAFDPYLTPERALDLGVEKAELDTLFAKADFITLHTPLTDGTRGIVDAAAIAKMKKGVRIINCARGGLVVEADLLDGLNSGQVGGAAFDVFENEPAKENALFGHENFIATPHLGASTEEAQVNVAVQVAEQIADYLVDGAVTNALNMPSVSAEEAPRLQPYMLLSEQLGSFLGQITESGITRVDVEYEGHATAMNTGPLTSIILQNLLSPVLDQTVNMVNAETVAKARGIDVCETKHSREGTYATLIRLTVVTENTTRVIEGTLFSDQQPRIVGIMGIDVESELAPNMLFVTNMDEPGFIGSLGTLLGSAGVNIANFNLGREAGDRQNGALALIHVDEEISDDLLSQVCALPQVKLAKALSF